MLDTRCEIRFTRYEFALTGIAVFGGLNVDFEDFFRLCLEIFLQCTILSDTLN